MNIVVITIDTLRYDYVAFHGHDSGIETPNLDRLASESIVCDRAYAASYPTFPHRTDVIAGSPMTTGMSRDSSEMRRSSQLRIAGGTTSSSG